MKCPICGRTYPEPDATYCDDDGTRLVKESAVPAPMAPPVVEPSKPTLATPPPSSITAKCKNCSWTGQLPSDGYCPDCGAKLETTTISPLVTPPTSFPPPPTGPTLEFVFPDSTKLELASFPARLGVDNLKMYPGSQFVSHSHLMVYCENGLFQVEDTNSLNGTSLNGKVIGKGRDAGGGTGRQPLKDGDWISLAGPFDDKGQGALTFTVRVIQHSGPAPH